MNTQEKLDYLKSHTEYSYQDPDEVKVEKPQKKKDKRRKHKKRDDSSSESSSIGSDLSTDELNSTFEYDSPII